MTKIVFRCFQQAACDKKKKPQKKKHFEFRPFRSQFQLQSLVSAGKKVNISENALFVCLFSGQQSSDLLAQKTPILSHVFLKKKKLSAKTTTHYFMS